jgi:hypothetical protein
MAQPQMMIMEKKQENKRILDMKTPFTGRGTDWLRAF